MSSICRPQCQCRSVSAHSVGGLRLGRCSPGQAERQAVNTTVQGSAADLVKRATNAIYRRLCRRRTAACDDTGARLVLQLHDELIYQVSAGDGCPTPSSVVRETTGSDSIKEPSARGGRDGCPAVHPCSAAQRRRRLTERKRGHLALVCYLLGGAVRTGAVVARRHRSFGSGCDYLHSLVSLFANC